VVRRTLRNLLARLLRRRRKPKADDGSIYPLF
jgi:hypothetical protein